MPPTIITQNIETIKKLNWAPDLIHVHGWIASLLPLYMKYYYNNDPIFEGTKVIVSLYDNCLEGQMDKNFVKKIKFDDDFCRRYKKKLKTIVPK